MKYTRLILYTLAVLQPVLGRRQLYAKSLVPCSDKSQLSATQFEVSFDPDSRALNYNLDLESSISGYVNAQFDVYAYGFRIISKTVDMCNLSFNQFCPLYSGEVIVDSTEYLSRHYASMIPGIAYTVPDIDGYVQVRVYGRDGGEELACMAAFFSNGKTVSHTGARWATAVVAGLGLLVSAISSSFGNSNAASHVSANAISLFTYFQSIAISSMLHVEYVPPIASAWAENLVWSMGLIRVSFMQKIFRWYVQATGGTPSLYLKDTDTPVLVQRDLNVHSSSLLTVLRGIKRIGYNALIEPTSIVVTAFTFYVLCGYALVGLLHILRLVFIVYHRRTASQGQVQSQTPVKPGVFSKFAQFSKLRTSSNPVPRQGGMTPAASATHYFVMNHATIVKGALLKYTLFGLPQLTIFSLWEFTVNDSPAVIILAVLFLITVVGIVSWSTYRAIQFGNQSIQMHRNPAAILYGNQNILEKYGFIYTMYNANTHWFGAVFLGHLLIKCVFVGLCQKSGKTQAFVIFLLDVAYMAAVIHYRPFLDNRTNILNITISAVVALNSFFFLFFSRLFNQPMAVGSIMGWIFFILNAAFALILLVLIITYAVIAATSKNPDARFRRAGDDRTSFQRNSTLLLLDEKNNFSQDNTEGSRFSRFSMPLAPGAAARGTTSRATSEYFGAGMLSPNPGAEELMDLSAAARDHDEDWEHEIYKLKDLASSRGNLMQDSDLELRSKHTIEELRGQVSGQTPAEDYNELYAVKPSAEPGTLGKIARSLSKKGQNDALNAITGKIQAMKLNRANSKKDDYQKM